MRPVIRCYSHCAEWTPLHGMFPNAARAREPSKTRDWVVLFCDDGDTEHHFTVITSEFGRREGQRIGAGREAECERFTNTVILQPRFHRAPGQTSRS